MPQKTIKTISLGDLLGWIREGYHLGNRETHGVDYRRSEDLVRNWRRKIYVFLRDVDSGLERDDHAEIATALDRDRVSTAGLTVDDLDCLVDAANHLADLLRTYTFEKKSQPLPRDKQQRLILEIHRAADPTRGTSVQVSVVARRAQLTIEEAWAGIAFLIEDERVDFHGEDTILPQRRLVDLLEQPSPQPTNSYVVHNSNIAALGTGATANRTAIAHATHGGIASAVVEGDTIDQELIKLIVGTAQARDFESCRIALDAAVAKKEGNVKRALNQVKKLATKLVYDLPLNVGANMVATELAKLLGSGTVGS